MRFRARGFPYMQIADVAFAALLPTNGRGSTRLEVSPQPSLSVRLA
jgi:hypothetical protein